MHIPVVNYWAVLVAAVVIFVLGGIWYSLLFAKPWMRLMGKTEEELKAAGPQASPFVVAFIAAFLSAYALAVMLNHFAPPTPLRAALLAVLCWTGFTGVTSLSTDMFSMRPWRLWLINAGYYLVAFVAAALVLAFMGASR